MSEGYFALNVCKWSIFPTISKIYYMKSSVPQNLEPTLNPQPQESSSLKL